MIEADRRQFDELYPDAVVGIQINVEGDTVTKIAKAGACWDCGRTTFWLDMSFYTHICSGQCIRNKWNEYWEATKK